jgi:hypothetical protein
MIDVFASPDCEFPERPPCANRGVEDVNEHIAAQGFSVPSPYLSPEAKMIWAE